MANCFDSFSYRFVWVVQLLVLEHVAENCGCCFGCFYLPRAWNKQKKDSFKGYSTGNTMKMHKCSYQGSWKSTLYKVSNLQTTHLLSCEVLMPISLDRPSKKVMSLAATELLVTKLLRMPQMFTTTSLEGSFWYPSVGSLVTRLFTTFVAG